MIIQNKDVYKLSQILYKEINKIPIFDTHSHIPYQQPMANNLLDILGYHYYTELCHSATYTKKWTDETLSKEQKVEEIVKVLPHISNTFQYSWLISMCKDFFGFQDNDLTIKNWKLLYDTIEKKSKEQNYLKWLLKTSNIEKIFLSNTLDDNLEEVDKEIFVPCLRLEVFTKEIENLEIRKRLEKKTNISISSLKDYEAAISSIYKYFNEHGATYSMIDLHPNFETNKIEKSVASNIYDKILKNILLSEQEKKQINAYIVNVLAENNQQNKIPMHLMMGPIRKYYQHGVKSGQDIFNPLNSMSSLQYLFNTYPNVKFIASNLCNTQNLELACYGWLLHNVYPSGHWWYSGNPVEMSIDLKRRLFSVPKTKLIGIYSDAYKIEFILPKIKMYKWILSNVLSEMVINSKANLSIFSFTEEKALETANLLLQENPKKLVG
ncbi:MAG: glucuronate isomerase [bacterium]